VLDAAVDLQLTFQAKSTVHNNWKDASTVK